MNHHFPNGILWALLLIMVGVFTAVFIQNQRQFNIASTMIELELRDQLEKQGNQLLGSMLQQEAEAYSLHNTPHELEANLFIVLKTGVQPACIKDLFETLPLGQCEIAFQKGIEALPSPEALPYFEQAAKRRILSEADHYYKMSAYFNILEYAPSIQTIGCILTLLEHQQPTFTEDRIEFFQTMLKEQVPDIETISTKLTELKDKAEWLDQKIPYREGAYRDTVDEYVLSVNNIGLAVLYKPDFAPSPPFKIANDPQQSLYKSFSPGLYVYAPQDIVVQRKQLVEQQHRTGNITLLSTSVLGCGLFLSLFSASRRQRQLDRMRTEFIATVSHELRTPLSLIRLHAETLHLKRVPTDKVPMYFRTILTETERLTGIVNNVLDFSRMERGKIHIDLEPTDLSECAIRIVESFQYRLEQDGFTLDKRIQPKVIAHADQLAFSQVLFNLLDNAMKYSDEIKHIRVDLSREENGCILRVADHGIGIPNNLKKAIFNDFIRSRDSKVTARRGSGIGLSVTQRLIRKMNGTIIVSNNEPTGSIFTVNLRSYDENSGS